MPVRKAGDTALQISTGTLYRVPVSGFVSARAIEAADRGLHDLGCCCLLIITAGNRVGGLSRVTLTHVAQAEE